jgi:hypothetical protein
MTSIKYGFKNYERFIDAFKRLKIEQMAVAVGLFKTERPDTVLAAGTLRFERLNIDLGRPELFECVIPLFNLTQAPKDPEKPEAGTKVLVNGDKELPEGESWQAMAEAIMDEEYISKIKKEISRADIFWGSIEVLI